MNAYKPERTLIPIWLERWVVTGLIGLVMILVDRRITSLEKKINEIDKANDTFQLQYVQDRLTLLEGQKALIHDLRVLCGQKNLNIPCPEEDTKQ